MITIRQASVDDADTVLRFVRALAAYEREPAAVEVDALTLRQQLAQRPPPFECLIAQREETPVAFALFFHSYSTWRGKRGIWLEDLFVLPEERGRGIGRQLLQHVAKIAVERECGRLEWSVLDWNTPAIAFYERMGAVRMTDWTTCRLSRSALTSAAHGDGE